MLLRRICGYESAGGTRGFEKALVVTRGGTGLGK